MTDKGLVVELQYTGENVSTSIQKLKRSLAIPFGPFIRFFRDIRVQKRIESCGWSCYGREDVGQSDLHNAAAP